jgi:hypothetical protein
MIDEAHVEETLRQLGGDGNAVAASLRRRGVKGKVGLAEHCPIANLLHQSYGFDWIEVESDNISFRDADDVEATWITPPNAVVEFIVLFDACAYPDLIEAGEPS